MSEEVSSNNFFTSLLQSFLIIFLSEIADKTFIIVVIFSKKISWIPLVITSFLAMCLMNIAAIGVGYAIPLLLVKSIVDWIGFICFLSFGIYSLYDGYIMKSETVADVLQCEINNESEEYVSLEDTLPTSENDTVISRERKSMLLLCAELFGMLCLGELGDKSELSTVAISAIYNFYGVLFGTMFAYFCTIMIASCVGNTAGKFITEKQMTIAGGVLFVLFAIQILFVKIGGVSQDLSDDLPIDA